jgi:uncharacterized protein (TIGR02678 family)
VAETALAEHLASERSLAIRSLLAQPLLDADANPDAFRLVARHAGWLHEWFERACGWVCTVDVAAGYARLAKRADTTEVDRPLKRTRGAAGPFDRRRYQLLCLICSELVRHPITTVGLLASAVEAEAGLDTSRQGERAAFVDALRPSRRGGRCGPRPVTSTTSWGTSKATPSSVPTPVDSTACW